MSISVRAGRRRLCPAALGVVVMAEVILFLLGPSIATARTGATIVRLEGHGAGRSRIVLPAGARGAAELLVVVEEDMDRVLLYLPGKSGARELLRFGDSGSRLGQFSRPGGAIFDGRHLWVSDRLNHRLQLFELSGQPVRQVRLSTPEGGVPPEPGAPALGNRGEVFVPDMANHNVIVLSPTGEIVRRWGVGGEAAGQLHQPLAIATSADGSSVYTIEGFTPRVQQFTFDGTLVRVFGEAGLGAGNLFKPTKVAVASDGSVYVADEALNRVTRFKADGEYVTSWGAYGTGDGQMFLPEGLAVDGTGRVWLLDHGNHRGQVFSREGEFLFTFAEGTIGIEPGSVDVVSSTSGPERPDLFVVIPAVLIAICIRAIWRMRHEQPRHA